MTEYEWEVEERAEQKQLFQYSENNYNKKKNETFSFNDVEIRQWWRKRGIVSIYFYFASPYRSPLWVLKKLYLIIINTNFTNQLQAPKPEHNKFNFMITVSMPVFDKRENAVSNLFLILN